MPSNDTFIRHYLKFCEESLKWCTDEAEGATTAVMKVLDILVTTSRRVSLMPHDTLNAVKAIRSEVGLESVSKGDLVASLKSVAASHGDVADMLAPIIEALQFQDRIRQNMENMMRMTEVWLRVHKDVQNAAGLQAFGTELMACTAMNSERDIIRANFAGMADEAAAPESGLF